MDPGIRVPLRVPALLRGSIRVPLRVPIQDLYGSRV